MTDRPTFCTWDGDSFTPLPRFKRQADELFVVGEVYPLVVQEERSRRSHNHYFACIEKAWENLPDALAMEFPTPEHLRKRALIATGFFDERRLALSSPAEARKTAAFLKPADDFALISVAGNVVIERKAKSQRVRAMGKKIFQESKTKVLEIVSSMIGTTPETLAQVADAPRLVPSTPRERIRA